MKRNNFIFGGILVFIGIFLLLYNLDLIRWSILEVAFDLWPLILIAAGASIVFNDKRTIKTLVWIGFFVIVIAYGFYLQYKDYQTNISKNSNINIDLNADFNASSNSNSNKRSSRNITYQLDDKTKKASLDLELGEVDLEIDSASDMNLLDGYIESQHVNNSIDYSNSGEKARIVIREKNNKINLRGNKGYKSNFTLSDKVLWDIEGDIGVVNGNIDFRDLRVNKLDLDFGAGDINLLLGNNVENLKVDIDAGATNINISVPKDLGVRVKLDGALKHSNLNDLNWKKENGWYISPNYENSVSKASIEVDMGVGNFELKVE
ncbi:hypothetical protein DW1_1486 [Proteiniborus sp. DW1]|uniref:LiaI-LiaF-like domain-containing protein n=1 Tax=Proteiniborus sp. DW1 TaxID=1889883 RepID=UPI00092E18D8|nr:DUF5668 domain-containing protein [Proteiniborus sp. DW1]SCG83057.1 hypothetical protein DW1_1486 [Proteiniborus sp. DW1]